VKIEIEKHSVKVRELVEQNIPWSHSLAV